MNSGPLTQPRQLVEEWSAANNAYVHALAKDDLVTRIASLTSEAATTALEQERESWLKAVTGTIDASSSGSPDYVSGFINGTLAAQKQIMDRLPVTVRPDAAMGNDKEQQQ